MKLTIHPPIVTDNGFAAGITQRNKRDRARIEVKLTVSDKSKWWTRGFSYDNRELFESVSDADDAVKEALATWEKANEDVLGACFPLSSSVVKAGKAYFVSFRTLADLEYDIGSTGTFVLEMRDVRRAPDSNGWSVIWKAVEFVAEEDNDAECGHANQGTEVDPEIMPNALADKSSEDPVSEEPQVESDVVVDEDASDNDTALDEDDLEQTSAADENVVLRPSEVASEEGDSDDEDPMEIVKTLTKDDLKRLKQMLSSH